MTRAPLLTAVATDRLASFRFDFIASTGRTATTFMASVLDASPGVLACHEGQSGSNKSDVVLPLINLENAQCHAVPDHAQRVVAEKRNADLLAEAPRLDLPVLVVAGADDPLAPPDTCRALAELIPGGATALIDRAGHYAALEQPEAYNATLGTFFDRAHGGHDTMPQE